MDNRKNKNVHRRVLEALEKGEVNPNRWTEWHICQREALDIIHRTGSSLNTRGQRPPAKTNNTTPTSNNKGNKPTIPCTHWNQGKYDKVKSNIFPT